MNIINRIKLLIQYPELKNLDINNKLLEKAMSDKHFKSLYKNEIKPFIKYLRNYSYQEYNYSTNIATNKQLDSKIIKQHISAILKSYKRKDIKYISFVKNNSLEREEIKHPEVLENEYFNKLFDLIGHRIFDNNIADIITQGHSERLIDLITKNPKINIQTISSSLFTDNVWEIIKSNPKIGNTTVLKLFGNNTNSLNILINIINTNSFEGLKYTYENIPDSHSFITHQLGTLVDEARSIKQFDIDFINNIGKDALEKLYSRGCFIDKQEFSKIFKIYESGNYELIKDIVNYDKYNFNFRNISDEDINKDLLNTNIGGYNKAELLLCKYFGIERNDNHYIKLFLSAVNKTPLSDKFKETYGEILTLLNQIYNSSDEKIIEISKRLDKSKKDEYKKLIYECEKEGNELIKIQFSKDLEERNKSFIQNVPHSTIESKSGKTINVYEFASQPFTMLVHAIGINPMSKNNDIAHEILNDPKKWNTINEGNNYISTSLINNQYITTYDIPNNEKAVMFGFYNIPPQTIKFMCPYDSGLNRNAPNDTQFNMREQIFGASINTVVSIDDLMKETIARGTEWNEIGISRNNPETNEKLQPNYIVCMDKISEVSKKAAEQFNIPIYLIKTSHYKNSTHESQNTNDISEENNTRHR